LSSFCLHTKAGVAVADQFDQGLKSHEGAAAPILREVAEEPVLDLVSFAATEREFREICCDVKRLQPDYAT
jgi:hypothetical protein